VIRERDEVLDLHEIARRVQRLVPSWSDPGKFYDRRDQIAHDLRRLARNGSPQAPARPTSRSEAERRLVVLARAQQARIARLEQMLAEACRSRSRPRRRRVHDERQLLLI
jgi:hypothetical protein